MKYKTEIYHYGHLEDRAEHKTLSEAKQYLIKNGYTYSWNEGNVSIIIYEEDKIVDFDKYSEIFD